MNKQLRKFRRGGICVIIGPGLATSRATMEAIIGEIRRDVPVFSEEEAFVAVLSEGGWNLTGGRRIIGLGMAFAVPTDAVIPESYRDMPA